MTRVIRITLGLLCLAVAVCFALVGTGFFINVVKPQLAAGLNVPPPQPVLVFGHQLQGWETYGFLIALAVVTLGLVVAGLFMIFERSDDAA